jgi:hypothetical protein
VSAPRLRCRACRGATVVAEIARERDGVTKVTIVPPPLRQGSGSVHGVTAAVESWVPPVR